MGKTTALLFIYHSSDEEMLEQIKTHLYFPLKNKTLEPIPDFRVTNSAIQLSQQQQNADLFVVLVSSSLLENYDSIASQLKSRSNLIPVLISPCEWTEKLTSFKAMLPDNRLPISSWKLQDEALLSVATGILELAANVNQPTGQDHPSNNTLSKMEREGLESQQSILVEKLSYLRKNIASMSEGAKKFELKKDIEQLEKELTEIQEKLT